MPNETTRHNYVITHLVLEILLRIGVVVAVCILALLVQPRIRNIAQDELLRDFKRTRRHSCVPCCHLICGIIGIPLVLFTLPWLLRHDVMDTTQAILGWTMALTITAFVTEFLKLAVGRPRPDFFYRCFPDGVMKYTPELDCTGYWRDIMEGRKSFPSGHTSFSFASFVFLSEWVWGEWRVVWGERWGRARVVVCVLGPLAAAAVGASRVADHRHHWDDVVAGALVGTLAAYCSYRRYYPPLDSNQAGIPYALERVPSETSATYCSHYHNTRVAINDRHII